jgi:hypothetical protein
MRCLHEVQAGSAPLCFPYVSAAPVKPLRRCKTSGRKAYLLPPDMRARNVRRNLPQDGARTVTVLAGNKEKN